MALAHWLITDIPDQPTAAHRQIKAPSPSSDLQTSDAPEDSLRIEVVEHVIDEHQHHGHPTQIVDEIIALFLHWDLQFDNNIDVIQQDKISDGVILTERSGGRIPRRDFT